MPGPVARRRQAIANRMLAEGWSVFNTSEGFPDLMCVKGGKIRMIKVYNPGASGDPVRAAVLESMKKAGLEVEVKGSPVNPDHDGHRMTTSVNIKSENRPFYEKLQQILKTRKKTVSTWFNEQMVSTVMEEMSGSA